MMTLIPFLVDHCSANASKYLSYEGTKCVQASTRTSFVWAHAGRTQTWGNAEMAVAPAAVERNCRRETLLMLPPLSISCGSLHSAPGEPEAEAVGAEGVDDGDWDRAAEGADEHGRPADRDLLVVTPWSGRTPSRAG